MALSTSALRTAWAPACTGPFARMSLHGAGVVSVRPAIIEAVKVLNSALVRWDYRTRAADTGAFNCRLITGGSGYSLHAYGIALDINWQSNPYGPRLITDMPSDMVAAIKAVRTRNGKQVWRWGGDYSGNKDAMHYEIVCAPADLATGIDPSTLPGLPAPTKDDDDMILLIQGSGRPEVYLTDLLTKTHIPSPAHLDAVKFILVAAGKSATISVVDAGVVDGIPRNLSDADWLRVIDGTATQVVSKLPPPSSGGTAVDPTVLANTVANVLATRLQG